MTPDLSRDYWLVEIRRLLWMFGLGLLGGYITSHWLISLLLVAGVYIVWILFKLRQLQGWLVRGQPPAGMPDSDGAWEQITYLIHRNKQKSETRKKKQLQLLMRFNNIMAALPDAAILINDASVIQWANRAAHRLVGIDESKDTGQRLDNLVRVPELSELLKSGENREIYFTSPREDSLTLSAHLIPVQEDLYLLNIRDISQRIHLQQSRKAFFANASHELRTPLTVLTGYLELFESDPDLPEYLMPAVQQSREQTQRMQQIISDMLALSRLENDEYTHEAHEQTIDVPSLFEGLVNAIQDTIASDSHTLSMDIDTNLYLRGKENDIFSLINNLTENAVKHTPEGTHIQIIWQQDDSGRACLSVEDNGPGIPTQHIAHLTERFYRVDKSRSRSKSGTGLGLAIVKHVMLNHGGCLDIDSQAGSTRFTCYFPPERVIVADS